MIISLAYKDSRNDVFTLLNSTHIVSVTMDSDMKGKGMLRICTAAENIVITEQGGNDVWYIYNRLQSVLPRAHEHSNNVFPIN